MDIIIDTNFYISCIKQKIDIVENLTKIYGVFSILLPNQIIDELNKISQNKKLKKIDSQSAKTALDYINKLNIKYIELKTVDVDAGIIKYIKSNNNIIVATLDKNLKKKIIKINNLQKFLSIRNKKYLIEINN